MWRWVVLVRLNRFSAKFANAMEYRVELSTRAELDVVDIFLRINAAESIAAAKWFNGLELAVCSLTRMPGRCPLAPESKRARVALYHLLYGTKPDVCRSIYSIAIYSIAIYTITETACVVNVLTVRHGAGPGDSR
jgi:toxin ParE1/3/4